MVNDVCLNRIAQTRDGKDLRKEFFEEAETQGFLGLKGHSSFGGGGGESVAIMRCKRMRVDRLLVFMKGFASRQEELSNLALKKLGANCADKITWAR